MINKLIKLNPYMAIIAILISSSQVTFAQARFEIRADGLACPYCAYGIEKKFMKIPGVKNLDIDLKKGLVIVTAEDDLQFEDQQLKTLFNDSGFTFRSLKKIELKK